MKKELNDFTITHDTITIPNLEFYDIENKIGYIYDPKEDITTYELAMLLRLFMVMNTRYANINYNYADYIDKNNLTKHFKLVTI